MKYMFVDIVGMRGNVPRYQDRAAAAVGDKRRLSRSRHLHRIVQYTRYGRHTEHTATCSRISGNTKFLLLKTY